MFTDRLGQFQIAQVNPSVDGDYWMNIKDNPGYQPLRHPLKPLNEPVIVKLIFGHYAVLPLPDRGPLVNSHSTPQKANS